MRLTCLHIRPEAFDPTTVDDLADKGVVAERDSHLIERGDQGI
jgi:hypothetical protein